MLIKTKIRFLFFGFIFGAIIFSACNNPLGMGEPIDWEPPVLTLDPKPSTPMYVRLGAQLTGIVTDNDVVDRVILRDSSDGKELLRAKLLPDNKWQIDFIFTVITDEITNKKYFVLEGNRYEDGDTILADVVAYDRGGNSGAESIASVVLIIDTNPPIVEDIWIQRSSTKTADIEKYADLKGLEGTDPNGELTANVNRYQNGAFHVKAKLSEKETRIESVFLELYDSDNPDTELFSLPHDVGSSIYNPQWLITEDMILNAGVSKLNIPNYKSEYKDNNKRYYYRLRIVAYDSSKNDGYKKIIDDQEYICLWRKADEPKGFLDPIVVGGGTNIVITKGSSLPVVFFDDDKINWAYAALFTIEQWLGYNEIADGVKITNGNDDQKFEFLRERLIAKKPVYNWRYDSTRNKSNPDSEPVVNLIPTPVDEKIHYIITGNDPTDYGEFVFVTLVKDLKQSPHTADYPDIIKYRKYNVNLVDENAPLIVFDKASGSPEENTFPTITPDGKFRIFGYTLREDKTGESLNYVKKFGLAWIPFNIKNAIGGPEENIFVVKKALAGEKGVDFPVGVQYWDLSAGVLASDDKEVIANTNFKKQHFTKTFNILGGADDLKPTYNNFYYNGERENTTKLFVFYAEDNMGHIVYTQFYLLGNKTPPTISVFDITDKLLMAYTSKTDPDSPPSVYDYDPSGEGEITPEYIAARDAFNIAKYSKLHDVSLSLTEADKTETYRAYPRGTIIKFWVNAKTTGDLSINEISMEDMTYEIKPPETKYPELGFYKDADSALSYVEYFPEVSQRVFLFTAKDSLGNPATVQRTIAIASAATLTSITTPKQNGTYPAWEKAGDEIELRANFDGMIKLQNNTAGTRPKLNVLYKIGSDYGIQQIECEPVYSDTLYLTFKFKVPENAAGKLETIYQGIPNKPASNPASFTYISPSLLAAIDRPITLTSGNNIIDAVRGDTAYTPGNVTGFFWNTPVHSLQDPTNGKNIQLDGLIPTITGIKIIDTKAPYSTSPNLYYFKSGESLSIELTTSKNLKVSGNASLRFRLQKPDNTYTPYIDTSFEYRKVTGNKIVFTLDVNKANILNENHGKLSDISIYNAGNITDDVGNKIKVSTFNSLLIAFESNTTGNIIRFDLLPPPIPMTYLLPSSAGAGGPSVTLGAVTDGTKYYTKTPYLVVNFAADLSNEPYGIHKRQYSLNNGLRWADFPDTDSEWGTTSTAPPEDPGHLYIHNGTWTVKTRYIDLAGNEGAATEQLINVNSTFPKLLGVKVLQPNATYIANQTLKFTLDFDDVVTAEPSQLGNITIALKNTTAVSDTAGGESPTYQTDVISPAEVTNNRTLTFTWALASNTKDMLNGLALASLDITGLKDRFGNNGPATASITNSSVTIGGTAVSYDLSGIKVSTIKPIVRSREPQNALYRTGDITVFTAEPEIPSPASTIANGSISGDNKTIKLNFSKPIQKGNGTITIRPHGDYAIPAVFENNGYYIKYTYDGSGNVTGETRSSSAVTDGTYVSGFYDVFNNVTDKTVLVGNNSMNQPLLSDITGLSAGPYLKTTHGLKQGAGYTGDYTSLGVDAPVPKGTTYMIPDLETKWVLDYKYSNLFDATAGTVKNIRAQLDSAKWRWQEIPVTNSNVVVSGKSVTITLSEPLLPGLQWDVSYTDKTFTDEAGNTADGETKGNYWFWSKGVQKPVIRVDRKSYDARASGNFNGTVHTAASKYNNTNAYNGSIDSFNTIAYRITSETPQASIFHGTQKGADTSGSITGAWTGSVYSSAVNWNGNNGYKYNSTPTTTGTWVSPNLIFRHSQNGTYNIDDGFNTQRQIGGTNGNGIEGNAGGQRYYGFRSFNKDATVTNLDGISIPTATPTHSGNLSFNDLEASKSYVAARARIDHTNTGGTYNATNAISSQKGFEGVFRTVIVMNQAALTTANTNNNDTTPSYTDGQASDAGTYYIPMLAAGTTNRSGLPTISGFPLKDGVQRLDSRYIKVFYHNGNQFYWVTTEIVTQWYLQVYGRGNGKGSASSIGDYNDWMTAGYGDLTYALNIYTN